MEVSMKQDLRVAVTKRMIKESLLDLLKTKPLNKIKIKELCETSCVNRATFYRHYGTLQDVLLEIERDFIKQIPLPKKLPKNLPEIHRHMEIVCTYIYDHSTLVTLLFLNKTDVEMIQEMNKFYLEFLEWRKEEIPVENLDDDTAQIILALLIGGGQCLLRKWILDDIHKTPHEIATILCNVIRWPAESGFFLKEIQ